MLNCKQATQMLLENLTGHFRQKEKLSLGMHTSMCLPCRQFGKQMQELRFYVKAFIQEAKARVKNMCFICNNHKPRYVKAM